MTSRNDELFERSQKVIPGGVNSPVRAFRSVGGTPRFFARGQGSRVWDADGKDYIDYVGSWGPLILGHADPDVVAAVQKAAALGLSFGAPTEAEIELAGGCGVSCPGRGLAGCYRSICLEAGLALELGSVLEMVDTRGD